MAGQSAGIALLALHAFEPRSRANGPGMRACVWFQGCTLGCLGCFNPETHGRSLGTMVPVTDVVGRIAGVRSDIEGVTISGGEPLQQWSAFQELVQAIRRFDDLSVLVFSGFTLDEVERMGRLRFLKQHVDVLVAGRYRADMPNRTGLVGSSNQVRHLFSDRYSLADLDAVPSAEVIIQADGTVVLSGVDPVTW